MSKQEEFESTLKLFKLLKLTKNVHSVLVKLYPFFYSSLEPIYVCTKNVYVL